MSILAKLSYRNIDIVNIMPMFEVLGVCMYIFIYKKVPLKHFHSLPQLMVNERWIMWFRSGDLNNE